MFGKEKIEKTIHIEGMSCMHCAKKVEDGLKKVKGVKSVKVSLDEKNAKIKLKDNIDDEIIKSVIDEIGFSVTKID